MASDYINKEMKGKKILEIGSGAGRFTEIFKKMESKDFYAKHPKASPREWLDWLSKSDYNSEISSSPQTYFVY